MSADKGTSENAQYDGRVGVQAWHQAQLDAGRWWIQRCDDCAKFVYFPREVCPHCGGSQMSWHQPSGLGTVYASTLIRRKADAGGDYNVVLVDLDEGVRVMSRLARDPGSVEAGAQAVEVGLRVQARVGQVAGKGLVVFDPVGLPSAKTAESARAVIPHRAVPVEAFASAGVAAKAALSPALVVPDASRSLRGSAVIAGVATFGCGEAHGFSDIEILARAARAAVADAGLTMRDIDGICTASAPASMWTMPVIEYLGLNPKYIDGTMIGGSSFIAHLLPAMRALASGQCKAILVCYGSAQRTAAFGRREIVAARRYLDPQPYEYPYEPVLPPSAYALAASRHMAQFGTTRRDLAEVAVAARRWAQLNPEAFMRDPLTLDQVLAARMVSDPLSVRDCCLVTDGGGAYVLVRADRANDLPKTPVHVLGNATAVWHRQISSMHDLTVTSAAQSGCDAYAMAGLAPKDVDVVQLYDAFTINTLLFLEDLGFCAKGEAGQFVRDGGIAPGGHLPVNTNGGGLSCVHPGMYGIFALIEAVRQLRGECGARQVTGAEVALAHGNGGTLSSQSTAILGLPQTL